MAWDDMLRGASPPPGDYEGDFYASSGLSHQIVDKYGSSVFEDGQSASSQPSPTSPDDASTNEISNDEMQRYRH